MSFRVRGIEVGTLDFSARTFHYVPHPAFADDGEQAPGIFLYDTTLIGAGDFSLTVNGVTYTSMTGERTGPREWGGLLDPLRGSPARAFMNSRDRGEISTLMANLRQNQNDTWEAGSGS